MLKYKKKEFKAYNLHMIKTDKFKTINMEIIFSNIIKKDKITINNFLGSILSYTTKKYPTKIDYSRKLEELYAARIFTSGYRVGKYHNIDFNITVLNDKYSKEGNFKDTLEFLHEVIFNPNVKDGLFEEDSFNVAYNDELSQIERIKEDPRRESLMKLYGIVNPDAEYSYNMDGYKEDLEKIDRKNLYEYYKEFINNSSVDIYVVGDIKFNEIEELIEKYFTFKDNKKLLNNPGIEEKVHNKKVNEVFEKDETNQAKLSIACTLEGLTDYEKKYSLNIYNLMLGGTADSKFFKNIREKHSLCYYISSNGNKLDNLLIIASGITKDNYKKIIKLINKEMDDMRKGDFSEEDLDKAIKYNVAVLEEIEDKPNQIIASFYAQDKMGTDSIEERLNKVKKVSKEDIMKVANKIHIDSIFLLGGDKK